MRDDIVRWCRAILPECGVKFLRNIKYKPRFAIRRRISVAKAAMRVTKVDTKRIPIGSDEIRAFMVVRNESLRLPFMLEYYLQRGVDRLFIVDNNSDDETPSVVLSHERAHLFFTTDDYAHQGAWIDLLLRRYGAGHWCLVIDADEVFIYPNYETVSLRELCILLDEESVNTVHCVLLDMYPDMPLSQVRYQKGTNPLSIAPWFDNVSYEGDFDVPEYMEEWALQYRGPKLVRGGMRQRVFGVFPVLSKFPLVKFNKKMCLSPGTHFIQGARVSQIRGGLLHFKYLDDFYDSVKREVERRQHYNNAIEYRGYLEKVKREENFALLCGHSIKYENSEQLVMVGVMKTSDRLRALAKAADTGTSKNLLTGD